MKKDSRHKYITYRADRDTYQITFPVTVPDPTSKKGVKKEKITKQCKTLEEALDERERLMTLFHLDSSLLLTLEKETEPQKPLEEQEFSKLFLEWFETIKSRELSVSSIQLYRKQVNLVALALRGRKIKDLSRTMFNAIVMSEEARGHGRSRALKARNAINSFLTDIQKPDLKVRVRIVERYKRREAFSDQELKRVFQYIDKKRPAYSFLYRMFFLTGCRRSELLGLTWRDVDFDHNCIRIEGALLRTEHYRFVRVDRTKTKASRRTIFVPARAMARLRFWYKMRQAELDDFVFLTKFGNPFNPMIVSQHFHEAILACGIKKNVSLHSARHTFATTLANAGVPMYVIQKQGGWGSLQTLETRYLHEDAEKARRYMEKSGLWDWML